MKRITVGNHMNIQDAEILITVMKLGNKDTFWRSALAQDSSVLPESIKKLNSFCAANTGIKTIEYSETGGLIAYGNIEINASNPYPLKDFPPIEKLCGNLVLTGLTLGNLDGAPSIVTGTASFIYCSLSSLSGSLIYVGNTLDISNNPIHSFINNEIIYAESIKISSTHIGSMDFAPRVGHRLQSGAGTSNDSPVITRSQSGEHEITDYLICNHFGQWSNRKTLLENLKETVQFHPQALTEFREELNVSETFALFKNDVRGVVLTSEMGIA